MKVIDGNTKMFVSINTVEYNWDGKFRILLLDYSELEGFGWDVEEDYPYYIGQATIRIDDMGVGTIINGEMKGVYLMRVA